MEPWTNFMSHRIEEVEEVVKLPSARVIYGPRSGVGDITSLSSEALFNLSPDSTDEVYQNSLAEIMKASVASFVLDKEVQAVLLEKLRTYTPLFDLMMLLVSSQAKEKFIHSINDLKHLQLAKILHVSEKILQVFAKTAKEPLLAAVAFNYQAQTLKSDKFKQAGIKTEVQTLDIAHAHLSAIALSDLVKSRVADFVAKPEDDNYFLDKREQHNLYDPMMPLIRRLLSIPSIKENLLLT